jgi:hypothetical protein
MVLPLFLRRSVRMSICLRNAADSGQASELTADHALTQYNPPLGNKKSLSHKTSLCASFILLGQCIFRYRFDISIV